MVRNPIHHNWQNINNRLYLTCHNASKTTKNKISHFIIWRNQHNVPGRFFIISMNKWQITTFNKHPTDICFHKFNSKKVIRKSLWKNYIQLNNVVFIEQMQQNKDIQYVKLLENFGIRNFLQLDFDLIKNVFYLI